MPFLKMKSKISKDSSRERRALGVCKRSNEMLRNSYSEFQISAPAEELKESFCNCHGDKRQHLGKDSSNAEVSAQVFEVDERNDMFGEDNSLSRMQTSTFADSISIGKMDFANNCSLNLETIFSPVLKPFKLHGELNFDTDPGSTGYCDNRSSYNDETCNVPDFFLSDVLIASLPFNESGLDDVFAGINPMPDYVFAEPSMLLDVAEQCMMLPFLEDKSSNLDDVKSDQHNMVDLGNCNLYLATDQMRTCNGVESEANLDFDQDEDFDPQSFIRNQPELSDVVSTFYPNQLPKEGQRRKAVTLVLDLDETLVHSTLEHHGDADFTFMVFFNMKEQTVYVKQRPHVRNFLEKVAEMFEVVVFTASQSIYAARLLDILDPDGKLISQRFYRESCILLDGIYTKDLTVLGVDLAKVAIIDNCPQVFRLQVNNGIPIKSWFDDPFDDALISLLPFLETLVDAADVRPIIANKFDHPTNGTRLSAKGKTRFLSSLVSIRSLDSYWELGVYMG